MSELNENNLIEKSKALVWSKYREYTLCEMRLFEVYLSKINPRNPKSAVVTFSLADYKKLTGQPELDQRSLKNQLKAFLGGQVEVPLPRGTAIYPLFSVAKIERKGDSKTSPCEITIRCNHELDDAFFQIAEHGYVRYKLKYTIKMKSQYSVLLYNLLKDKEYLNTYEIKLQELREQLMPGSNNKSYDEYRNFRKRLIKAVEEINEYTDLIVSFEPKKQGRKVTSINFTINKRMENRKPVVADVEATESDFLVDEGSLFPMLEEGSVRALRGLVRDMIKEKCTDVTEDELEYAVRDTLKNAYDDVLPRRDNVENPAAYLRTAIINAGIEKYIPATYGKWGKMFTKNL